MTKEVYSPVVPDELQPLLTDRVMEVYERFANYSLDDIHERAGLNGDAQATQLNGNQAAVKVIGVNNDPSAGVNVLGLPHQQAWKPSMAIRALMHHDINNPEGVTIVLPNGSVSDKYYTLSPSDRGKVANGDMRPFYEQQARTVEGVTARYPSIGAVVLDGYSLGGLTSVGIAAVGSDRLDVRTVHSVEAPNVERTPKQLRKDFMKSGTLSDQRAAITDAGLPVLSKALRMDRLLVDYARFGVAAATNKDSKALNTGMATPEFSTLVEAALRHYEGIAIRLGYVAGSKLFDPGVLASVQDGRVGLDVYTGEGSHKHATGDNPLAHALMMSR